MLTGLDLTIGAWATAIGAILFAAVLRGFTGFGFALAAVPLASSVEMTELNCGGMASIQARNAFASAGNVAGRSVLGAAGARSMVVGMMAASDGVDVARQSWCATC